MRVVAVHRYPVESLQGESLERADVGPRGLDGPAGHAARRPVLGPFAEDGWVGRELEVGEVVLRVREPMRRCVTVGAEVLHEATRLDDGCAGLVVVDVVAPGTVAVGDVVRLLGPGGR
ncbi:MOSC domain-containing protein [Nocardioides deserti]|uniref:MOSC domain-containing protein n=1 Tax=Nocardioides deserti TaxID=1588644 RepID=A0ABR6U574_9ACTN|nr:hypothetical protein [Nocardioides deserti]MBC2959455.1 hypothetical protein [Nocardioides deserti]GGO73571.1 hypothetical protein GCM10012276_19500 [Nocardioides deserti]